MIGLSPRDLELTRLRLHFRRVDLYLRGRPGVAPWVREALRQYGRRGEFPGNLSPTWSLQPVFHDPRGPVCAVACLLHTSDRNELANDIAARENGARVSRMASPGLDGWAMSHGLSRRDLQVIQPSYPAEPTPELIRGLLAMGLLAVTALGFCLYAASLWVRRLGAAGRDSIRAWRPWVFWLCGVAGLTLAYNVAWTLMWGRMMTHWVLPSFVDELIRASAYLAATSWVLTPVLLVGAISIRLYRWWRPAGA